MRKNTIVVIVFVCCLVSSVYGQDGTLSLAECIKIAIQNNPTLKRDELAVNRADIRLKQAENERLPSLNANLRHSLSQGRTINPTTNQYIDQNNSYGDQSLSLNAPLFNGFSIINNIRMKSNAKEAGKLEYDSQINALKLDVITAYVKVLTASDMLKQLEGQLEVTKEQLHRHEVLNKEGAVNPGDLYDLKGQFSSELNNLELTKQTLNDARLVLAMLLNIDIENLGQLDSIAIPEQFEVLNSKSLYEKSLLTMPQYKALDYRIKEMEHGIKVAKSGYFPSLTLGGGLSSNYSKDAGNYFTQMKNNLSKFASIGLSIPIFNKFNVKNQVKLAKIDFEEAEYNKLVLENDLRMKTAKAVFDLKTAQSNVQNLKEQEVSYQESFRIATVVFEAGNSNSVIYLTAKNKLDMTRSQLLVKKYEWLMQKFINDYYAGSLDL